MNYGVFIYLWGYLEKKPQLLPGPMFHFAIYQILFENPPHARRKCNLVKLHHRTHTLLMFAIVNLVPSSTSNVFS